MDREDLLECNLKSWKCVKISHNIFQVIFQSTTYGDYLIMMFALAIKTTAKYVSSDLSLTFGLFYSLSNRNSRDLDDVPANNIPTYDQ